VRAAVDKLSGKVVQPRIDTGAQVVTRENMAEPAVKDVLAPDLRAWL
jgi:ABC-type sugar transport system substrate-binding protein